MRDPIVPEPVRVLFHLNGEYTKVLLERRLNPEYAIYYEPTLDITTAIIPFHLRPLGSRFMVTLISYDPCDLMEAKIEEIDGS